MSLAVPADMPRVGADVFLTAVVDIGSNSVRMVVYAGHGRTPVPVFNERTLCGLGRNLARTRYLDQQGIEAALQHLRRFSSIGRAIKVGRWEILATEAVRSAIDGPAFVDRVSAIMGYPIQILSGEMEAEASALGVVAGIPDADGMMGDLGGGSLEIVKLDRGRPGERATLPLGALRLTSQFGDNISDARVFVAEAFARVGWLKQIKGRTFYPVGGAWRAFANVHMGHTGYPLHVIHGYRLTRGAALDTLSLVSRLGQKSLGRIPGVPKARLSTLHLAAVVMESLLTATRPDSVVFSANGLREGWLFRGLSADDKASDPLLVAAADMAQSDPRFPTSADILADWIKPLFPEEGQLRGRLRKAAAHLSDIGWRTHPDYRAADAFFRVLHLPFTGIDHRERVILAFAISARYGGGRTGTLKEKVASLVSEDDMKYALVLGRGLRLALSLSGGVNALLTGSRLQLDAHSVTLSLSPSQTYLLSDVSRRRLSQLAKRMNRTARISRKGGGTL